MKKLITLALALLIAALALTACTNHNHSKYDNDSTYHWIVCDSENCADEGAKEYHSYNDFRFNASGDKEYTCTVCGYVYDPAENDNVEFANLPEDYACPLCAVGKDMFEEDED